MAPLSLRSSDNIGVFTWLRQARKARREEVLVNSRIPQRASVLARGEFPLPPPLPVSVTLIEKLPLKHVLTDGVPLINPG